MRTVFFSIVLLVFVSSSQASIGSKTKQLEAEIARLKQVNQQLLVENAKLKMENAGLKSRLSKIETSSGSKTNKPATRSNSLTQDYVIKVIENKLASTSGVNSRITETKQQIISLNTQVIAEQKRYDTMKKANASAYNYHKRYHQKTKFKNPHSTLDLSKCRMNVKQMENKLRAFTVKKTKLGKELKEKQNTRLIIADVDGERVTVLADKHNFEATATIKVGKEYKIRGMRRKTRDGVTIKLTGAIEEQK